MKTKTHEEELPTWRPATRKHKRPPRWQSPARDPLEVYVTETLDEFQEYPLHIPAQPDDWEGSPSTFRNWR